MFYTLISHEIKRKCKFKLTFIFINKNIVDRWQRMLFISFPLFRYSRWPPIFKPSCWPHNAVWSHWKIFYCLLGCSNAFNQVGHHTGICQKVVLALFDDFAYVAYCCNDKDMTSYEGYQKSNSFRRYFNQIYWEKLSNKLIITSAK